jgi:hypothetical protein
MVTARARSPEAHDLQPLRVMAPHADVTGLVPSGASALGAEQAGVVD